MNPNYLLQTIQRPVLTRCRPGAASLAALLFALSAAAVPPPTGVAPVSVPAGGFAIDGDLTANSPLANVGDWLPGPGGTGGSVLDAAGAPLNPATTFHFVDPYNSSSDNTFSGGLKWTDDPGTWTWTTSKAGSKTDINNVLLHLATDADGHLWVILAADRFSTSGDSYIDFEFLQSPLVANTNGTFTSAGPNGGRTVNDFLLNVAFTSGGSTADFFAWRWMTNNATGGYAYFDVTTNLPTGKVFVAASPANTPVPFGAFGQTNYGANAFAEAAVDLTELLGNFDPCLSIGVATIMVKTKTSQSSTATISDFINPIQYTLRVGPSANAGPDQTNCTQGASTAFALQGHATPGLKPIASTTWSVVSGSATIDSTNSLSTTAHVSSPTATLRLTAIQSNGCTETDDVVLTVVPVPTCSSTGPSSVCPGSTSPFSGPAGMASYAWSVTGNGSISGPTNSQTVNVVAGPGCGAAFTLSLTTGNGVCANTCSTDVMVVDTVPPVITSIPADVTVQCAGAVPPGNDAAVIATDNCPAKPVIAHSDLVIAGNCPNNFVIQRTYTATDSCGNASSAVQNITVNDNTAPLITHIPADVTVQCASAVPPGNDGAVTATDNCGGAPLISHNDQTTPGSCVNNFVIQRTYTATDSCGNSSSAVQTITVNDNTAPVISSIPKDVTVQCASALPTADDTAVSATDNCGGVPVISHSDQTTPGTCANKFVIKRTYTATDACGNSSSAVQTITVNDNTAPVITSIPADVTVQCASAVPAATDGAVVATDACGGTPVISHGDQTTPGSCPNKFVVKRTYTATDACGNSSSAVQTITVNDTTAPTITSIPADVTVQCASAVPAATDGAVSATDACAGTPVISHSDQTTPGTCVNNFVLKRTYTATDSCGNSSTAVQTITVNDTTGPVITSLPADLTVQCASAVPAANNGAVTATDACGGTPVISHSDQTTPGTCVNNFVIKRTYTATDTCGNSSSAVQTITVNDTTAPVITSIPADVTVQCASAVPPATNSAVVATDNCGGTPVISHSDQTIPGTCLNKFVIKRTYTATDACGNSSSAIQTITVNDTTAPVITSIPSDVTVQCASAVPAGNDGAVLATDACGGTPAISHSDQTTPGSCPNRFVLKRTYTATDACGNSSSAIQTITVNDTTAPVISSIPADVTVQCANAVPAANDGAVVATDNCGGSPVISHSDQTTPGACVNNFVIKRTYTATDSCGNSSSAVQTITVNDTTGPAITSIPKDVTVQCASAVPAANNSAVVATDACGGTPVISNSDQTTPGSCPNKFVIKRTYTATDACGNSSSSFQTITVNDNTAPVLTLPPNVNLECPADPSTNNTGVATAVDNCSSSTVSYSDVVSNTCGAGYVILRTWTATDTCGNHASAVQTIAVRDTTAPVIKAPANVTLECPADTSTNNTGVATASDTCSAFTITYTDFVTNKCGGTKTIGRNWTATDACGNHASALQTITVRDTTPPTITAPANLTLECGASTSPSATGTATAQDGCSAVTISYADAVTNLCGGSRIITRQWTATDACGNAASAPQTITVRDTTPPSLTVPANLVLECPGDTRTNVTGVAIAQDVCSSVVLTYSDIVSNSCGATKTVWRMWTATDACGNTTNGLQTITVQDTTPPRITCPTIAVQCADDVPAAYADLAAFQAAGGTASDACSTALTFSLISDSGLVGRCPGKVTRVYRVTDECGNSADGTQTITVDDTIPPVITCASNVTVECGSSLDPATTGQVSATDNCSTNVALAYTDTAVSSQYALKFYAADSDTNTGPYGPTYLKLAPASLPYPAEALVSGRAADPLRNAVAYGPTADQLDALMVMNGGSISLGQVVPFEVVIWASGAPGPERGTIEFTADWSTYTTSNERFGYDTNYMVYCAFVDYADPGAIDPNYNAKVESFSSKLVNPGTINEAIEGTFRVSGLDPGDRVVVEIWVVLDSTAPKGGGTVSATLVSAQKATVPPQPISTGVQTTGIGNLNKLNPLPAPAAQPPLGPLPPQPPVPPGIMVGVINRLWTATDDCGNQSTCTQQITVRDTTPPALNVPADLALECPADTSTNTTGVATAQDACGSSTVTYSDTVTNGCGGTKVISRLWTATDGYNTTNRVQTITVQDTTPPVVTAPANLTVACTASLDPSVNATLGMATATDGCSGASTPTYSDQIVAGNCAGNYTVNRTWTSHDNCGNIGTALQTITVQDTTAPVVRAPANLTIACTASLDPSVDTALGVATATDGCSGASTPTYTDQIVTGNCAGNYTVKRIWSSHDDCGNIGTALQTITVQDTTPPVVTAPANLTIACTASLDPSLNTALGLATATDGCSGASTATYNDQIVAGNCAGNYTVKRTWTSHDNCGNIGTALQTITVQDTTAPVVTPSANLTIACTDSLDPSVNTALGMATATDGCSGASTPTYSDQIITGNCAGNYTVNRTWTSHDNCGNIGTALQTITVQDTTPPTITVTSNLTVVAGQAWDFAQPVASDTCSAATVTVLNTTTNLTSTNSMVVVRTWQAADACGNTSTAQETVTILEVDVLGGPTITQPPQSQTVQWGSTFTLTVGVEGSGPYTYQWSFDGNPIAGATNTSLTISNVQFTNAGTYTVVVTDSSSGNSSASGTIYVAPKLIIQTAILNGVWLYWPTPYILMSATNVVGPYLDVLGATSPWFYPSTNEPMRFFRLRSPGPITTTGLLSTRQPGSKFVHLPRINSGSSTNSSRVTAAQ